MYDGRDIKSARWKIDCLVSSIEYRCALVSGKDMEGPRARLVIQTSRKRNVGHGAVWMN